MRNVSTVSTSKKVARSSKPGGGKNSIVLSKSKKDKRRRSVCSSPHVKISPPSVHDELKHLASKVYVPDEDKLVATITGAGVMPIGDILYARMSPLDVASVAILSVEDAIIAMIDNEREEVVISIEQTDDEIFICGDDREGGGANLLIVENEQQNSASSVAAIPHGLSRQNFFASTKKFRRKAKQQLKNFIAGTIISRRGYSAEEPVV
ncbi:MAG: hypothetical protein WC349_00010 [Patescibacteria group bacterium]|jgi:hypothetical protein